MENKNPYVNLGAALSCFFVGTTALVVIFAREYAWILIFIALAFVLLGVVLGRYINKEAEGVKAPMKKR
jgi:hypothetical protein